MDAYLALEDGKVFKGKSFGAEGEKTGEVVFNTSMAGYQEILTDPSYRGQIVTMTYPLIGNYGINPADIESDSPKVEGFAVKEWSRLFSNWRGEERLEEYLKENGIMGIEGIDTRALTRHIRTAGAMKSVLSTVDHDRDSLIEKARSSPGLIGRDLVTEVTCKSPYLWSEGPHPEAYRFKVVVMDFGVKYNILRKLTAAGCEVQVVPASTSAGEVMAYKPDGLLLSNGPGDPAAVPYVIDTIRNLLNKLPIFGICLGHQLLGLAFGGNTYKLKFGHRGGNQPVKNILTGKVDITSQNHGFCVDIKSLDPDAVELTHINLNDQTVEGMRHRKLPIFSVQYHPEASPGPHDAAYLFDEFIDLMK